MKILTRTRWVQLRTMYSHKLAVTAECTKLMLTCSCSQHAHEHASLLSLPSATLVPYNVAYVWDFVSAIGLRILWNTEPSTKQ